MVRSPCLRECRFLPEIFREGRLSPGDDQVPGRSEKHALPDEAGHAGQLSLRPVRRAHGQGVRVHSSSGTTGNATVVGYTKNDIDVWAEVVARCLACAGGTEKDVIQVAYGYGLFTGGPGAPLRRGEARRHSRSRYPAATPSGSSCSSRTSAPPCSPARRPTPSTSPITSRRSGPTTTIRKTKLRAGIFGAEPWSEGMRKEIETRLGIDAYDIYGLSEVIGPGVSCECRAKSGLHVFEDHFYVEIIDPDTGDSSARGREGRDRVHLPHQGGLSRSSGTARGTSPGSTATPASAGGRWSRWRRSPAGPTTCSSSAA